jgi:hypothetical protein
MSVTINTTENQERYADLTLRDIESAAAFSSWLSQHLVTYATGTVSKEHLLIFLTYIQDRIDETDSADGLMWKKAIVDLKSRLGDDSGL